MLWLGTDSTTPKRQYLQSQLRDSTFNFSYKIGGLIKKCFECETIFYRRANTFWWTLDNWQYVGMWRLITNKKLQHRNVNR